MLVIMLGLSVVKYDIPALTVQLRFAGYDLTSLKSGQLIKQAYFKLIADRSSSGLQRSWADLLDSITLWGPADEQW